MYGIEFWLWNIVPIVNSSVFVAELVCLLFNLRMHRRWKMVLAFTATSFVASFVGFITMWLDLANEEPGYRLNPIAPYATYTIVTAWVAGIGFLFLGLWKLWELFRSPKTDEKKE